MNTLNNAQNEFIKNLVSSLEKNKIPWQTTWDQSILKPYNVTSNKNYKGINQLNLWMTALQHGYDDPRWMSFKQANEKGYKIKKGSVGTYVFNYALRNLETNQLVTIEEYNKMSDEEKENIKPFSKTYKVFNGSQIEGIPALDKKKHQVQFENDKAAEFIETLHKAINLKIEQTGQKACYIPNADKVLIPPQNTFMDEQSFYATLLHETAHATSHIDRLNRSVTTNFGTPEYALEELRAEITSAFLTLDIGFHFDQFHASNHTAYIQSWIEKIKSDPKVIFDSIRDAQEIREYMLDKGNYEEIYVNENVSLEQSSTLGEEGSLPGNLNMVINLQEINENNGIDKGVAEQIVMDQDEYLGVRGLSSPVSDFLIDKIKGNRQLKTQKGAEKFKKDANTALDEYQLRRYEAIQEYKGLVKEGKIRPRTTIERSIETAHGHPDHEATHAARRMLEKRGVDWRTGADLLNSEAQSLMNNIEINNQDVTETETINLEVPKQKQTVVIDLFGGPGSGKTTCAWEIAAKLKKLGYVAEYVPEYAKELVWDGNMKMLDGTLEHQQALLKEQVHRVDRLIGKVDFVVTDSPVLMNLSYLKEDNQDIVRKYEQEVVTSFNSHHNFSMFIKRGNSFETIGRIHNQEESIKLDQEIKGLLEKNKIFFGNYSHDTIDKSIDNCIKTYNRLNGELIEEKNVEVLQNGKLLEGTKQKNKQIDVKQIPLEDLKNSISIVEYARGVLGFSVIKESRGLYRLEEHDSCKIYPNNTFCRFSRPGVGGSVLDFIKHFEECDTKEAIDKMQSYYAKYHPNVQFNSSSGKTFIRDVKEMELPEKAETNKHVFAYLTKTRGIKPSIVQDYIDRKVLYEDINRNCVFVGKLNGTITYATLRSSNNKSTFKQDVLGSIKETGIYIDNGSDTLVVNEATIDQMSYQSLTENPRSYDYLSTCGAANCLSAVRLHMMKRSEAQRIKRIIIGLDADEAGETNTFKTIDYLKENFPDIETLAHIPEANDFNDQLRNELNILACAGQETESNSTTLTTE